VNVIFRADGDSSIGLGHIMRSAALMQILQKHFHCELWTKNPEFFPAGEFDSLPTIKKFYASNKVEEAEDLVRQAPENSIIVLDGYHFDTAYQVVLKKGGLKVICIDDMINCHFVADAVINHAGGIKAEAYSCNSYTQLYLGPEYALVKPAFYFTDRLARDPGDKKILISLGAADPNNATDKVLSRVISLSSFVEIKVIIGAANPHFSFLKEKYSSNKSVNFLYNLSVHEMIAVMHNCTYSVLAPSTICYEYMTIGGIVFLYDIADNQQRTKQYFINGQLAYSFNDISQTSLKELQYSLQQQQMIFDRKSPERLLNIFYSLLQ
jgi:UDP-2,4-diacetamido-2,4,6-trideoxy-beta-L-altropyranose hydrolase